MAGQFEREFNYLVITAIVIAIFSIIYKLFKSSAKSNLHHNLPPGPKPWPILGNIPDMLSTADPHVTLFNLSKTYGPLMHLRLGTQPLVVASSPETAREILKSKDRIFSGRLVPSCLPFGQSESPLGWIEDCNDHWKLIRTLCRTELFSNKAIESQAELREKSIGEMIGFLTRANGSKVVKISELVFATVFNMLGNAMMSRDFISLDEDELNKDGGLKGLTRE